MRKYFIVILFIILLPGVSLAQWDDCASGEINDQFPGSCGSYIDTDKDEICDHSQPAPENREANVPANTQLAQNSILDDTTHDLLSGQELKAKTVEEAAQIYGISSVELTEMLSTYLGKTVKSSDSFQLLNNNYGLVPSVAKDIILQLESQVSQLPAKELTQTKQKNKSKYNFVLLAIIILILYYLTLILVKIKKLTPLWHRRIWNLVLLLAFFGVGISGLLLVIRINYGWSLVFPFNLLYWHVEIGISMAIVAILHIAWHWRYFACIFNRNKKNNETCDKT